MKTAVPLWAGLALLLALPTPAAELFDGLQARCIGPANMGGRIVDVAVVESRPATIYVATASGGLWKTVNNGTTWAPVFDQEATVSLGDVTVAPSNPDVVWVGTGEANPRNSVTWGDGVYKSLDGGKSWKPMGLKDSRHVGRIVIHPKDPDTVYVAALGHLWGANKERGVFKTTDGGQTWNAVQLLDEDTGFIDLAIDPSDPETLYACAYAVRRDGFSGGNPAKQFGDKAGLYKTVDGGKTWTKLTQGLPSRPFGRCGLDVWRKDPKVLYAVIQTDRTTGQQVSGQAPRAGDSIENGGVFRSDDKGESWKKVNDLCPRPFYYGQVRIDPTDDKRLWVLGVALHVSGDGGRTFRNDAAPGVHPDHHALWIDPRDPNHLILGNDGGLYFTYDRGAAWEHLLNLPIGQFYAVGVDMRKPYWVYGGLQDNGSWGGPSATRSQEGVTVAEWARVLGADGFFCQVDPTDPDTVYAEGQYGALSRVNVRTGQSRGVRPQPPRGAANYRFNWSSPLLVSSHNPRTLYYGGNHVFKSVNRGDKWDTISPDLTLGKPGPNAVSGHTLTALAESPLKAGLVYAGSDDGKAWVTRNGGADQWTDLSDKLPGVPAERWITRVEPSRFDEGTAYLSLSRYRHGDLKPYVFKTTDYGATWKPLAADLPEAGPVHVVREDLKNKDLLFVGTEFGLFATLDGGASWRRLKAGLPTVAVHDLVIHPRDHELVIATHGRSVWVLDSAPLSEMTEKVRNAAGHLCDVKPAVLFNATKPNRGLSNSRLYSASNPPFGAAISYHLKEKAGQPVRITIADALGNLVTTLRGSDEPGLHRVMWNLRAAAGIGPVRIGPLVAAGDYVAKLEVGDKVVMSKKVRVEVEE